MVSKDFMKKYYNNKARRSKKILSEEARKTEQKDKGNIKIQTVNNKKKKRAKLTQTKLEMDKQKLTKVIKYIKKQNDSINTKLNTSIQSNYYIFFKLKYDLEEQELKFKNKLN